MTCAPRREAGRQRPVYSHSLGRVEDLERPKMPPLFIVIVGALALFGLVAMVQWAIGAVLGLVRLALLVIVVVAVVSVVVNLKRDD